LLNFENGVVDLRTGKIQPASPDLFITKIIHHKYNPAAQCHTFMQFLSRAMGASPEADERKLQEVDVLLAYLQRAFGYSLTGVTSEKAVFLLHGNGDNGKSTLLATFLKLMGEYSVLLQIDTLMAGRGESNNSQADLADLRGARFVMTSETEDGQRLAEGKLKRITQGTGKIKAVRKYENPIEFDESHKLWVDANHLPVVRGTDNAIWNRLHPIPFTVTIPRGEQDRQLPAKLLAEAEGILAWAVHGAVLWYRGGLTKPQPVESAGASWRTDSDQLGRFILECCVSGDCVSGRARKLYDAFKSWAEQSNESVCTETAFCRKLLERGYKKRIKNYGSVYEGLGVRDTQTEAKGCE